MLHCGRGVDEGLPEMVQFKLDIVHFRLRSFPSPTQNRRHVMVPGCIGRRGLARIVKRLLNRKLASGAHDAEPWVLEIVRHLCGLSGEMHRAHNFVDGWKLDADNDVWHAVGKVAAHKGFPSQLDRALLDTTPRDGVVQ